MRVAKPASPIFRNERARWFTNFMSAMKQKSRLAEPCLARILKRCMTRRPAHVLLMRPEADRICMLMEILVPAVHRAERKAGLR